MVFAAVNIVLVDTMPFQHLLRLCILLYCDPFISIAIIAILILVTQGLPATNRSFHAPCVKDLVVYHLHRVRS